MDILHESLELERRVFIISQTYTLLRLYFSHWQKVNYEPESIFKEYLKRVLKVERRVDFCFMMSEFLASFKNGHTGYGDNKVREKLKGSCGFLAVFENGKWFVVKSGMGDISPGSVIKKIDGESFEDFYNRVKKRISASSERQRRINLFGDTWNSYLYFPGEFELEFEGGKRVYMNRLKNKETPEEVEGRWLKRREVAYIKIPDFAGSTVEDDVIKKLETFKDATYLIIDVRGNRGGRTPLRLIEALQTSPYQLALEETAFHIGSLEARGEYRAEVLRLASPVLRPRDPIFEGEIIILADRFTHSAAEDFLMAMKSNGRATIVGERTCGSTGQPYVYNFGDGIVVGIGAVRTYLPDGSEFEGIGVKPDIELTYEPESLKKEKDPFLKTAMELI
jgi:carboxyl-terminal processing protease